MKRASITEAKNTLSALVDRVKAGASVLIVDRGQPVARLEPVTQLGAANARLAALVRQGIVRPARGGNPAALIRTAPPRAKTGTSAVRALLDERRSGR